MILNQTEPDKERPCWVLLTKGRTKPIKGFISGHKLVLAEFHWYGGAWRRTDTPMIYPGSLYQALRTADWVGKLPHQGRKRPTMTSEMFAEARTLFQMNLSARAVAKKLKIGQGTAQEFKRIHDRSVKGSK